MRPGNCSGSYSEPPRARAIALRSSSCPREVDATTFSIRNLAMGTPPGRRGTTGAVGGDVTQVVPYILRSAPEPHPEDRTDRCPRRPGGPSTPRGRRGPPRSAAPPSSGRRCISARKPANRVSNPCRTEALDFREVGIVGDNATPETKRCSGNHAVRHRQIPMHALQEPGLARQLRVELHHLQASVLKGPELGQRLSTARLLTDGVRHLCDHDGRKNSPPFLAQRGQLRSSPGKNFLVLRSVVGEQEFRVQDFLQSLSSRDSSRTFNRRSRVVFFEREPPRSSRLGTGRMSNESPRSWTSSRLPSLMR